MRKGGGQEQEEGMDTDSQSTTGSGITKPPKKYGQMNGNDGMVRPPMPTGELKNFLKDPLTTEERDALKTLLQTQQKERQAIMEDTTITPEEKATQMKALITTQMTAMLVYVSTDKQDAFKKMMDERVSMVGKNQEMHKDNKDGQNKGQEMKTEGKDKKDDMKGKMKGEKQEKKQALSEKLRSQLDKAVSLLPVEKLNKVLANIDKAVTKVTTSTLSQEKKDRFLAQLEEIRTIIQDKIDELAGNLSSGNILNEVLSGVTTDTGTGTSSTGTTTTTP